MMSAALVAPLSSALAAPPSVRQPAMHALDDHGDHGLLDSMADKGSALISQVRDGASSLVDSAMNVLGVRYKLGGNSAETGFDCSGFTRYVFENSIGRVLPHRADEQANAPDLAKVDQKDLKPGDLVFFNTMRRTFSHVGIYLGDGKFIHSPRTGESVRIEDINISYWASHFTGARRVPELASADAQAGSSSGNSMLAALAARFGGSASHAAPGAAVVTPVSSVVSSVISPAGVSSSLSSVVFPVVSLATSASLNPSGLRIGSTLPSLPERSAAGFVPLHEPLARPIDDR